MAGECVLEGQSDAEPDATVTLTLADFTIEAEPAEVDAGAIELSAENVGSEPHEVVIVQYDGDPEDLPTDEDGRVDESALPDGATIIGEIEEFVGGETCAATFDLEPGDYVLLCNIVEEEDDGEMEAHFAEGMHTTFTVN